jgi:hypothetical protein
MQEALRFLAGEDAASLGEDLARAAMKPVELG